MHPISYRLFFGQPRDYRVLEIQWDISQRILLSSFWGARGIHMGRKITVILRDGRELTYRNAKIVEGNKTWIYLVDRNERPEELLALIDPHHIRKLYAEED